MSSSSLSDRFSKLRAMRESLCKKEKTWSEAFEVRDWVVSQLILLRDMTKDGDTSKKDLEERIEDILCTLNPDGEKDDE